MAQRLTTYEDLEKYPELRFKGVSLNQHFDFDAYEELLGNQNEEEDEVKDELPFTKKSNRKKAPVKKTAKKK